MTSVKNKNKIYNKFCKAKDQTKKQHLHEQFKTYRNSLVNSTRQGKANHYKNIYRIITKSLQYSIAFLEQSLKKLIKKTPKSNKHFSNYLNNQNLNLFLLDAVKEYEIESKMDKLGLNSTPAGMLKAIANLFNEKSDLISA